MKITLTASEVMQAANVGMMRQVQNTLNKAKPAYGAGSNNDWQLNIEGALGECALAKFLGVYWVGTGKMRAPDVGDFDVRTTTDQNNRLILHPDDPDDRIFWLLIGKNGYYDVRGWIRAADGKRDEFWADPTGQKRHAFFVPQSALNSAKSWFDRRKDVA